VNTAEAPVYPVSDAPPTGEALELARALVKRFHSSCFWFRHPDATVESRADIYLAITHLREYGGHAAWTQAQQLWKCL
jgi:hypothetical protein